jgi:excinuclease ABC subunit A
MANFLPTTGFPRLDRFKEHTIELPVFSLDVQPDQEAALRAALAEALQHGKGVLHVLSALDGLQAALQADLPTAGIGQLSAWSTLRACPVCATSYAELDPRLFSYNSKHGWCPDCVGTGVQLSKEQRGCWMTRCATTTVPGVNKVLRNLSWRIWRIPAAPAATAHD